MWRDSFHHVANDQQMDGKDAERVSCFSDRHPQTLRRHCKCSQASMDKHFLPALTLIQRVTHAQSSLF